MAQTHMQGPLKVSSHGPASKAEIANVRAKLQALLAKYPELKEPQRAFLEPESATWRFGAPPDYTLANYAYLTGKTKNHTEGSLELIVENLVKTWEMERSHKLDPATHKSVDQEAFAISANGGKVYNNVEANKVGNYNVLLDAAKPELYDAKSTSWEQSHLAFHDAFAAFPWEVLEVFSGPPTVGFTWRHWGTFTGSFKDNRGKGELIEMFGFATAKVNDKLQLCEVQVYYNADAFLEALLGKVPASASGSKTLVGDGKTVVDKLATKKCPFNFGSLGASRCPFDMKKLCPE